MLIQKYKAKLIGSDTELIGYISETRKHLGNGTYGNEIDYVISVTELSMPNSIHRGTFIVDNSSIEPVNGNQSEAIELLGDMYNDCELWSDIKFQGYGDRLEKILNTTTIKATDNQLAGKIVTVSVEDTSIQNLERIMEETGADVLVF